MGIIGIRSLLSHGFEISMVFSHMDNPDENRWFGSVAEFCHERRIPTYLPEKIEEPPWPKMIKEARPDLLFSFYYRSMVGRKILSIPRLGSLNLHGSLLPKYRGRAPVNWVLVNGESETGVTLHFMVPKPDAGDIAGQIAVAITCDDTALTLYRKLEKAAESLLNQLLPDMVKGIIPRRPNEIEKGSYFGRRKPDDGQIDWTFSALRIYNLIRAVTRPYPGAFSWLGADKCVIWWAKPVLGNGLSATPLPGTLSVEKAKGCSGDAKKSADTYAGQRVVVGTGEGLLQLEEVEWRGYNSKGEDIVSLFSSELHARFV
jgi:UDP-4-amino-4-deoxy-L-arabinose formyltransferase/UDP-glucuronic acid dehydrogenase (UDP-4-keto-hexauronic acid decarboxylating)